MSNAQPFNIPKASIHNVDEPISNILDCSLVNRVYPDPLKMIDNVRPIFKNRKKHIC